MPWTQLRFPRGASLARISHQPSAAAVCLLLLQAAACVGPAPEAPGAQDEQPAGAADTAAASAGPQRNPLRNAYFGDLHVHSSWSLDAWMFGHPMNNDPSVAYRYGRGEPILDPDGYVRGQLAAPLDFMAVTDHDNWLGEVQLCQDPEAPAYDLPVCRELRAGGGQAFLRQRSYALRSERNPELCGSTEPGPDNRCDQRAAHQWTLVKELADAYYEPGVFTTFTAFEFSGVHRASGGWLHRNVFFRGPQIPPWGGAAVSRRHSPERLWEWMEAACTGDCDVIAIPHNTNYGRGVVLAPNNADGTPFTAEILERRARLEPLIEIHQVKGNSECAPGLLTADEECDFEQVFEPCDPDQPPANAEAAAPSCTAASDVVRNALKTGLEVAAEHGINPFKYGLIGSTDDHRSMSGSADEETWQGDFFGEIGATTPGSPLNNPGGLAAVWAEENTRDAIFDALRRREAFATSGPRIRVRFFGGWALPADLHARPDLVEEGYRSGVPMGGDLPAAAGGAGAPLFVVWATRDANSAALQKLQIVKGWNDPDGGTGEQVYDVACDNGQQPDPATRRCADNGAQVNLADCSTTGGAGAAELSAAWSDPEFDPTRRAFYYVRVLENPTCRWTTWQALRSGGELPDAVPPVIKERAWSSPIWHTPDGS